MGSFSTLPGDGARTEPGWDISGDCGSVPGGE